MIRLTLINIFLDSAGPIQWLPKLPSQCLQGFQCRLRHHMALQFQIFGASITNPLLPQPDPLLD